DVALLVDDDDGMGANLAGASVRPLALSELQVVGALPGRHRHHGEDRAPVAAADHEDLAGAILRIVFDVAGARTVHVTAVLRATELGSRARAAALGNTT